MSNNKVQRIKLQPYGSPIKLDATILEYASDHRSMKVSFDAPVPDKWLYVWTENTVIDRKLGENESPAQFKSSECQVYKVL